MKTTYRGFEIEAKRDKALGGWSCIHYYILHQEEGWFLADSFSDSEEKIRDFIHGLKSIVDDYYENPEEYEY